LVRRSNSFLRAVAGLASVVLLAAGLGTALLVRTATSAPGIASGTPDELRSAAATAFEAALASGGTGARFEIIQTSTLKAKPGGPKVDIPDPAHPRLTLELADEYQIAALLEHGTVSVDGFFSEMQAGPPEGAKPDWEHAPVLFSALVLNGERWRNDGDGWYRAEALPGIGLDPETASALPRLLRNVTSATDKGSVTPEDGVPLRAIDGEGKEADAPGVVAAGGERFTDLTEPITFGFDADGRLAWLRVVARNTNSTEYDLVIETDIRLAYDNVDALPAADELVLAPVEPQR
jgi:hypothetical protein